MLRVGLTGGIACGKSHVARALAASGLAVVDLDAVAHAIIAPGGAAHDEVVAAFGPAVLSEDGAVDRKALGRIVFSSPADRARLEAIVHPRVRQEEARLLRELGAGHAVVVAEAALLVEAGLHLRFDRLVVVHCPPETQIERLRARDLLPLADARARLAAQMDVDEKRRFGHEVVDTSGTLAETDARVAALAGRLSLLASRPVPPRPTAERLAGCLARGPRDGPRGLGPWRFLRSVVEAGGVEMPRLAALLEPPSLGPWYRAAGSAGAGAAAPLAVAAALWATARRPGDEAYAASVAATLARLTHRDGPALAEAVLFALALSTVLTAETVPAALRPGERGWLAEAERWGGAPPPPAAVACLESFGRAPASSGAVPRPEMAAALAGAGHGVAAGEAPEETALVRRLLALAAPS